MISNNYSAEFGHSTGGVVTMSTRSGTNQYHGSVFESLQNDVFNARNFFAATRPPIRLNQYGASFGGPVRRDKTFFFVTWERTGQLTSDTLTSTVPTLLNRGRRFLRSAQHGRQAGPDLRSRDHCLGRTRQPFAGNVDSAEPLRPGGAGRARLLPAAEPRRHPR